MYSQTMCETIGTLFILNMFFECHYYRRSVDVCAIGAKTNTKYVSEIELKYILFTNALLCSRRTIKLSCWYIIFTLYSKNVV